MERRGVLRGGVAAAVMALAGLLPYGFGRLISDGGTRAEGPNILRPPGALANEAAFAAACIGCGLCGEVCPPRCIKFHKRDAGGSNLPYIDASEKGCILCDRCMSVCPTEALTQVARQDIDMGLAQIDRLACYPWVDRGVCGACVTICPLGNRAISFDFANLYRPVVRAGCVGCGLCVEVCPHPSLPIRIVDRARGAVARHEV